MRKIFTEMSSWSQLFFLWLFFVLGFFISSLLVFVFAYFLVEGNNISGFNQLMMESVNFLRISQVTQQLLLFFIPACLCAYLFNQHTGTYLKINKSASIDHVFVSVLLIFIIQPVISFTSYYNQQLQLPEFMSGIEAWMRASESNAAMLTERMLSGGSLEVLMVNLIIVAVFAAVVEEFFFRGVLQQIFGKIFGNYHWAVWITAFIFSAIHMQFFGFVPRLLLGALLGYLFVFTGNLWIPVLAHFINNAAAVLLFHFYKDTPQYEFIENIGAKDMWWTALLSFFLTVTLLVYLSKQYTSKQKNIYF